MQKTVIADADATGRIGFYTQTLDVNGVVTSQVRTLLEPGHLDSGVYVKTDTSTQPAEVVAVAAAAWTQSVHDAFAAFLLSKVIPDQPVSQIDDATIAGNLIQPGSVVRALGLVTFQEINKLRVLAGQSAYTMPQFVAALKANIR